MQGYLITNAFMRGGSFENMRVLFEAAARRQGIPLLSRTNADFMRGIPRGECDFALFYDKDIRLAQQLEAQGVRVFNSAAAIAVCDDKTLTYLSLQAADIPQPESLLCPMTFPGVGYGDLHFVEEAADILGLPMVIKEGCGSFGQQVYLAQDVAEAKEIIRRIGAKPALFQRFVSECAGHDERLFVVDGQVIAAIRRESRNGDFRANIENGGYPVQYTPTAEECALAVRVCKALQLDFAGVDLLPGKSGPLVCEVNSNAHFAGLMQITGVNPADHIISYIRRTI